MTSPATVAPWYPATALLLAIGQSVGPVEAARGRPFIGPAGQQLREWLAAVGLDPDRDVAYTNVVMDFDPDAPNYVPTPAEVASALPRIVEELERLPAVGAVVLLGASAAHLVAKGPIGRLVGTRHRFGSLPAWPCWHPSYYLRAANYRRRAEIEGEALAVLRQAAAAARGEPVPAVVLPTPSYVDEPVTIA